MSKYDLFFNCIGVKNSGQLLRISKELKIPTSTLHYYNTNNILPSEEDLHAIEKTLGISAMEVMLRMGIFNTAVKELIAKNSKSLVNTKSKSAVKKEKKFEPKFQSALGS